MICIDSGMGFAQHEDLPVGTCDLSKFGGGVWRGEDSICSHQEHEKEPQLPWKCSSVESGRMCFCLLFFFFETKAFGLLKHL